MTTKNPTAWQPQPLGYGYVTQTTPLNLVTETGAKLITQTGAFLVSGTQSITGKAPTVWSGTGA